MRNRPRVVYISEYGRRVHAVFLLFCLALILCVGRLLGIQLFLSHYLADIAKKQHNLFIELEPRRGTIFDYNLKAQASNISADSLYASSAEISDKVKPYLVAQLAHILNLDTDFLRERLSRPKSFVWLARKISASQSQAIRKLNIKGIGFIKETKRCYPNGYLTSHVIGFAGLDNVGLEGLELCFDRYLRGESGWTFVLRDARQKKLDLSDRVVLPKDGYDLIMTIDEVIQYIAERELDKACKASRAKGGSIIVMNPYTGAILAVANRPSYDLNEHSTSPKDARRNRAVCDLFEPGSVFKIVTASAALEEHKVKETDRFFCENGAYKVANHILHDHQKHGWLTFAEVIQESSNIGTTKVAQILGPEIIYRYAKLFGFGVKSGIDIPGEINGILKEPRFWSKTSIGAIPIGQEVGVTALQLANAISAIANGGLLMRPYIVSEIRDKFGETIKKFSPQVRGKVLSPETVARVKKILQGAVEEGTGKLARIEGYSAAGKTGTAQKIDPNGSYSQDKFVASFIGFAPAQEPVVAIVVTIDEPRTSHFGGVVSAPVFRVVAQDVLRYLKVKPTTLASSEVVALHVAITAD